MKMQLSSICIVIPYFGEWPFWLPFFLASCRENVTINWLIYTDCGAPESVPNNVRFVNMSYREYCMLVSNKLNIQFKPQNPYKLCDVKPALGLIHEDELSSYDFWAFGDLDLVYGNLRDYFTESRLSKKQVFSTHKTRVSGHLCLLKNTAEIRCSFKTIADWERKFIAEEHLAFDEKDFSKIFLRHKNSPNWVKRLAAWKDPWLKLAQFDEAYTTPSGRIPWIDGTFNFPSVWHWTSGELKPSGANDQYFPYFHFMIWKEKWSDANQAYTNLFNSIDTSQNLITKFYITEKGFTLG